ncbi:MAG: hypothetical protein HZB71_12095 [Betaproteobacteria bacterium]|nr:hypothetical protein [Betaproteobacteria bacterium]
MSLTYCMTSTCPLAGGCQRYEDNASAHCLKRTYADFSEELVRGGDGEVSCPFFLPRETPDSTSP